MSMDTQSSSSVDPTTSNMLEEKLTCIATGLSSMIGSLIRCIVEAELAAQQLKAERLRQLVERGECGAHDVHPPS